jgi:GDP-4-dehydro-6-deoxy-D-mannose reductase
MKALITGINGFVGNHLARLLLDESAEVTGIDISAADVLPVRHFVADIGDCTAMGDLLGEHRPDHVYHLAAPSFIPDSYDSPKETFQSVIGGTVNLLEAIRKNSPNSKFLFVGSSDEYGVYKGLPFREDMTPEPCTPYAAAKAAASVVCGQYARFYGLDIVRVRSFNHIGPGQSPRFACSSIARQIALAEKSAAPKIILGNLDASRDFLDVRDVCRAYFKIMNKTDNSGELYNICSGRSVSIRDVLEKFLTLADLSEKGLDVISENQCRKYDNEKVMGDNSKLKIHTDWNETITFEQTIADTLNYWRGQV